MFSVKTFNKKLFVLMLACSLFPTAGMGTQCPKSRNEHSLAYPRILKTNEEMWKYGNALFNLCNKGDYEGATQLALPEPTITVNPLSASDLAQYHFHWFVSMAMINIHSGRQLAPIDKNQAKMAFQEALGFLEQYMNTWEKFVSRVPQFNERMKGNHAVIAKKQSEANSQMARLMITQDMGDIQREEAKKLLVSSIEKQKKHIMYMEKSKTIKENKELFFKSTLDLFNEYCTLIPLYAPEDTERTPLLKEAKEIRNIFKRENKSHPQSAFFLQEMEEGLKLLEQFEQRASFNKEEGKKGKIAAAKEKKQKRLDLEWGQKLSETVPDDQRADLHSVILLKHQNFCNVARNNLKSGDIVPTLKEIEEKIRNHLVVLSQPSDLPHVYKSYANIVGAPFLIKTISTSGLAPFLLAGDVEAALERVNILSDLECEQQQNNSCLTRFLRAAIKSMNGDYEEWLNFEEEVAKLQDKKKEKKERQKQKQRETYVAAVKQSQEEFQRQQEIEAARIGIHQPHPPSQRTPTRIESTDLSISSMLCSSLPPEEAKKAKIERHEKAQKRREEERQHLSSSSSSAPSSAKLTIDPGPEKAEAIPLPGIVQTFSLTGVAKDVEEAIQSNTWKFSRKNAIEYFKALGCMATEGGKHKKVSFPKAIMIHHEGKLLTIINDLGGALTLPRWDEREGDGTVPYYLRKQISAAREKLLVSRGDREHTAFGGRQ